MKMIKQIEDRIEEIKDEIMLLVDNQTISLTQKNTLMQPLIEESKVMEYTLVYLNKIKNTNYQGLCKPS
ncbi:MAG: hypothetical protein U9Q30_06915 [Campylobacterota bacterium]|nr:hypothetical protein [Campylobacterota bacterium]